MNSKMSTRMKTTTEGFQYDFFAQEWEFQCGVCKQEFYTPNKKDMLRVWDKHTKTVCLGGW